MIELSPQVKEIIDNYLNKPISYGTESHALCDFRDWVIDEYKKPQLVCLWKDTRYTSYDRETALKHYRDYFKDEPRVYDSAFEHYAWVDYRTRLNSFDKTRAKCEKYFHKHIGELATHACIAKYGSVKTALLKTETWIELWNEFEKWFQGKREGFMAKMDTQIAEILKHKEVAIGKNGKPAPVGAVANLCKELRRTMERQGADITSIAKVQYALCVQNGVYIPDEFLTDVAIALDATGEL